MVVHASLTATRHGLRSLGRLVVDYVSHHLTLDDPVRGSLEMVIFIRRCFCALRSLRRAVISSKNCARRENSCRLSLPDN